MKTILKKLGCFAVICCWILGLIGGVGFSLYDGSVPCAIGSAVLAILSLPTIKRAIDYL